MPLLEMQDLWHHRKFFTRSLGCQDCHLYATCGGLEVAAPIFDCMDFCCNDPSNCDNVCPRHIEHQVARSMEIGGFALDRVWAAPIVSAPTLPLVVPLIYSGSARSRPPQVSAVALSLYQLLGKKEGVLRFASRADLLQHFKLADETTIILTGADEDPLIERCWARADREQAVRSFTSLGIAMIATPNYSLFSDVPRHDNLFNMKRTALVWSEIQREGMPCALHMNARTDRDWERWAEFLVQHPEISHVAFEFATGAGAGTRIGWYVDQLATVARKVGRPLHLVVRGGVGRLADLRTAYAGVTLIETNAFLKSQMRRRFVSGGKLEWQGSPTPKDAMIDDLLDHNVRCFTQYLEARSATGK